MRFAAVHGQRSVIMGYAENGLEVWGYPFQILRGYHAGFKPRGASTETDGRLLLRRTDYHRDSITRLYAGPGYIVREQLFVPLDEPAAVITYEVEGSVPLDIQIHFQPVLDLMWPGAVGGQYTKWTEAGPGYQIAEPASGVSAMVASAETVEHNDVLNSTIRNDDTVSFTIRPKDTLSGPSQARVVVLLNPANAKDPAAALHALAASVEAKQAEAKAHYAALDSKTLRLHTPDASVNEAIASAKDALDQAWVCNEKVGCGMVAGYGPSRAARRPQYLWYFAGDGLIATNGLLSAGEYSRAREELAFIMKFQEPQTGMMWHEISQSWGYIDWLKYPYMYVHVDVTFQYLSTLARYVRVSGDAAFAQEHWASIEKAYRYCRSLIRESDHQPHIPADKEGGDEQGRPADDLGLSAAWVNATSGFEELARLTGHVSLADEAHRQNELARKGIPDNFWSSKENFWIDGHAQSGKPIAGRRQGPIGLVNDHVFSPRQNDAVLDQLASPDFRADWGLRQLADTAEGYDPYGYGRGSVFAIGSTQAAITFWREHRPAVAEEIWSGLLPWDCFDAPGHLHEVLAGNFYQEQAESVPEQTWSSAGLMDAAVRGLLGLEIRGDSHAVTLAPHLPPQWDHVSIEHVQLPGLELEFTLDQSPESIDLDMRNSGDATHLSFEPEVPLGARLLDATFAGRSIPVESQTFAEDQHAKVLLELPRGTSHFRLRFAGGVSIIQAPVELHVGDASTAIKLTHVRLHQHALSIEADVHAQGGHTVTIRTPWKILSQTGASVQAMPGDKYEITLQPIAGAARSSGYQHAEAVLTFAAD